MNKYQPQSPQRPQGFSWVKTKNENNSKEIDSSLPFDFPGKKGRGRTKRRQRAQRSLLIKSMGRIDLPGRVEKRASFPLASRT
jgi:hypothetical protein